MARDARRAVRRSGRSSGPAGDLPSVLIRLIDGTPLDRATRAGLLRRLTVGMAGSARRAGALAVTSGQWLTDQVVELAPHVPIRDYQTLREHHDHLIGDALARSLVESAARTTGALGAASGALSAVEFTALPLLLSSPVQIAAETIAVVGIELKLVAELHEVYGRPAQGTPAVRTAAYLGAWTRRRGLDPFEPSQGIGAVMSGTARRELRRRVVRRAGENSAAVLPLMAGVITGATLNARETKRLGEAIITDLGGHP